VLGALRWTRDAQLLPAAGHKAPVEERAISQCGECGLARNKSFPRTRSEGGYAMVLQWTSSYVQDSRELFCYYKSLADKAIAQVADEDMYALPDEDANSIAIVMKHMAGNMKSRWTDFLCSDGEKPWRNRDSEFERPPATRQALLRLWEEGWACVFETLESLTDADLGRTVTIRGEAHSVMQAINRQMAHYSYHCGQIVLLAKHLQHATWKPLTVPKGKSAEFNAKVYAGEASQR
jgi:uncharacterized damage-inducible protein DinB